MNKARIAAAQLPTGLPFACFSRALPSFSHWFACRKPVMARASCVAPRKGRMKATGSPDLWAALSAASSEPVSVARWARWTASWAFPITAAAIAVATMTGIVIFTAIADVAAALMERSAIGGLAASNCGPGFPFAPSGLRPHQFFSRYPVRKIHQITARQIARNATVMPMLTETLTSAIS